MLMNNFQTEYAAVAPLIRGHRNEQPAAYIIIK